MRRATIAVLSAAALTTALAGMFANEAGAQGRPTARHVHSERTCAARPTGGFATCFARVVTAPDGKPKTSATPGGYGPADIRSAYGLGSASGSGKTVAIVDAYDDPTAEADLATYRSTYGLPACTSSNGCFRKVNQSGGSSYPRKDAGWATEISLDLDMVSASCPDCHILLVEANSASFSNLGTAVNYAASQGVSAISNSYGGSDSAATSAYDHPGIAITASTGDNGYGVESPASFDSVVAVGGTSLSKASNSRGWTEKAWSGAGSGCSTKNAKPSWQTAATQCSGKALADVSAVADPATGVSVYDSTQYQGRSGWQIYGGTSASSPIIASVYAMGGNLTGYPASYTWSHSSGLNDVTSGSNGSCTFAYLCTALTGFDGPTGMGTPNSAHPTEAPPTGGGGSSGGTTGGGGDSGGSGTTTAPPANPTPPAVPVPTKVLSSVAVRGASSRPARNGRFRVEIACGSGPACSGVISLQIRLRGSALRAFGRASYSLASGSSKWVVVRLSSYNLRLLKQKHRLRIYGTARDGDGTAAQSSFSLRAPKPLKYRKR